MGPSEELEGRVPRVPDRFTRTAGLISEPDTPENGIRNALKHMGTRVIRPSNYLPNEPILRELSKRISRSRLERPFHRTIWQKLMIGLDSGWESGYVLSSSLPRTRREQRPSRHI
jgi:hypothetical protein